MAEGRRGRGDNDDDEERPEEEALDFCSINDRRGVFSSRAARSHWQTLPSDDTDVTSSGC